MRTSAAARLAGLLLPLSMSWPDPGHAATERRWHLGAGFERLSGDNLLRLADGAPPPAGLNRSDSTSTSWLLADLSVPVGRQRAYGSWQLGQRRFDRNVHFDHPRRALSLGLQWSWAERWTGTVETRSTRALADFDPLDDSDRREPVTERFEQSWASLTYGGLGVLSLHGRVEHQRLRLEGEADIDQAGEFAQRAVSGGVRWHPRAGFRLGLEARGIHRQYAEADAAEAGAGRVTGAAVDVSLTWLPAGGGSLDLKLGRGRWSDPRWLGGDSPAWSGSARWTGPATARVAWDLGVSHQRGPDRALSAAAGVKDRLEQGRAASVVRAGLSYRISHALVSTGSFSQTWRHAAGLEAASEGLPPRDSPKQKGRRMAVGLQWSPGPATGVRCDAGRERRQDRPSVGPAVEDTRTGSLRAAWWSCRVEWRTR